MQQSIWAISSQRAEAPHPQTRTAVMNKHGVNNMSAPQCFIRRRFISPSTAHPTKLQLRDPTPRHRCRTIMQNPIGFDLGTISRPGCCAQSWGWEGRGGGEKRKRKKQEASLIEFYVAVVGDLNMPEFITRRIIMPYKKWQSQIGPHTSSLPPHHWGGPVTAAPPPRLFQMYSQAPHFCFFFFSFWKWNICVWHWSPKKINMNLETIHSVRLIIFWQIYLPVPIPRDEKLDI